jgi:hypothetical protein
MQPRTRSITMPSASDFDQDFYLRHVIEPAVSRRLAPRDLLARYAITSECARSAKVFRQRVDEVVKYWRSIQLQRRYQKLINALMVGHDDLADRDQLSYAAFVRRRDEDRARALEHLQARAGDLAAMTDVIGQDTLDTLSAETGWLLTEEDAHAAVRRRGVSITDELWELPPRPDRHCRGLAEPLATLGLTLAAEAVFDAETVRGGFRLRNGFLLNSGDQLNAAVIDQKKQRLARSPLGTRKTAMENVLTTLQSAASQPVGLDQLLLWQLIDTLEAKLAAGYLPVSLARAARELGLDPAEASMLALGIHSWRQPARGALRKEAEAALDRSHVREAQHLAAGLPPDSYTARQIAARIQRIEKQLAEADRAEDRGQREQAADALAHILATDYDSDGQLAWRLQGLVPPPPVEVTATPGEGQVYVTWGPGPARPGEVTYRVVRQTDSPAPTWTAGVLVAQTGEMKVTDVAPPTGERLHYTVFASRGRDLWSAGTAAAEVILLPDVASLRLEALASSVVGSWQVAPGTSEVVVTRTEGEPPSAGCEQRLTATLCGFLDESVQPGRCYFYRICAVYISAAGERLASPGVLRAAIPEPDPVPVVELRATVLPGLVPEAALTWVATPAGTVAIYQHAAPSPWPAGTVLRPDELARLGRPVAGTADSGEIGASRAIVPLPNGRTWFTAVTSGVGRAALGATAEAGAMAAVQDLQARRYGTGIQLSWDWPDGCHECRVGWRPAESPARAAGQAICGDWEFNNSGGFLVEAGPGPVTVWVRAILRTPAGLIESAAQEAEVPRADVIVWYRFQPPSRWPGHRARLVLTASQACELPALLVVRDEGRLGGGEPVSSIRAMSLAQARPAHVPVPTWRPGDQLTCSPGGDQAGISLVRFGGVP